MQLKKILIFALLVGQLPAIQQAALGQVKNKKPLFTMAGEKRFADEFIYAFNKNNTAAGATRDSINSYLQLYINFRLKVKAAGQAGYDTTTAFKKEFALYKNQLDETYLSPKKEEEALLNEAYQRSLWQIKASHILVRLPKNPTPADTLKAYQKIQELRTKVLDGQPFAEVAAAYSQDPSAKQNNGNLGYFTVFQMLYPFENMAYNTPVGQVSTPFRTRYGYHIVWVQDKRPNQGTLKVAHIMIRSTTKNSEEAQQKARQKIYTIDSLLQRGANWDSLCQLYTQDLNSKSQNGELPPFGRGQIVPEFEQAAYALRQPGDMSKPVQTPYGWHIIKLVGKIPVKSFDEQKTYLQRKIKSDSRSLVPKAEMMAALKKEYHWKLNPTTAAKIAQIPASAIIKNKWVFDSTRLAGTDTLFMLTSASYTSGQFLGSIQGKQVPSGSHPKTLLQQLMQAYQDSVLLAYATAQLPAKHPDYAFLLNEYYDGILLFSIMEDSVWNKAMQDSLGLQQFYTANIANYYQWHTDTIVLAATQKEVLDSLKSVWQAQDTGQYQLIAELLKENPRSTLPLQLVSEKDSLWKPVVGQTLTSRAQPVNRAGKWHLAWVVKTRTPALLPTIKGRVVTDYQTFLDTKWINELRKRYPVKINKKQLNNVYAHFKATH